jgi:hypothetical protein
VWNCKNAAIPIFGCRSLLRGSPTHPAWPTKRRSKSLLEQFSVPCVLTWCLRRDLAPTNPRGIPYAPFVDKVEDYVTTRADVEKTLKNFQEMISYDLSIMPHDRTLMREQEISVHGRKPTAEGCRPERQDARHPKDARHRAVSKDQKGRGEARHSSRNADDQVAWVRSYRGNL